MSCPNSDLKEHEKVAYSRAAAERIQVNHPEESEHDDCNVTWVTINAASISEHWKTFANPIKEYLGFRSIRN